MGPHVLGFPQALTLPNLLARLGHDKEVAPNPRPSPLLPNELPFGL